jgi:hypothetical protein
MGCTMNADGDYCLAVTYEWFVSMLAVPADQPALLFSVLNDDQDDDLTVSFSASDCRNVSAGAQCCIGSFLNVRIPAEFQFLSPSAVMLVTELPIQCDALGVPVNTDACPNSEVDICTQLLELVPTDCQSYVLTFPAMATKAEQSEDLNAYLCNNPCFGYLPTVVEAFFEHPSMSLWFLCSHCLQVASLASR